MKLPEFELERYFARHEFEVPYLLGSSDIEGYRMAELLSLADDECWGLWERLSLGYTESAGDPLLRREISGLYGKISPEQTLTFAGAEEAIFAFMNVLLGPGDHTVVVSPAYQSLHEVARATGADVALLKLGHEEGWAVDPDELRAMLRPTTKVVVVNFPHNPTGYLPDPAAFAGVVEAAREAGAYLLSDEVYRLLEHDPADRLPAAADLYEKAASLGVMSKAFGLAGLRIGWVASQDASLLRRLAAFKDYTTICNSAPSEALALVALRQRAAVLERSLGIVRANLPLVDGFFERWRGVFEWVRPKAGCIGFPRLLADVPVEEFAADLAGEAGVLLLPGGVYGPDYGGKGENHLRIGFGRTDLPEALERLERFVARRLG